MEDQVVAIPIVNIGGLNLEQVLEWESSNWQQLTLALT
jgi:hypothetical protein